MADNGHDYSRDQPLAEWGQGSFREATILSLRSLLRVISRYSSRPGHVTFAPIVDIRVYEIDVRKVPISEMRQAART
jgi:hypothetical protein